MEMYPPTAADYAYAAAESANRGVSHQAREREALQARVEKLEQEVKDMRKVLIMVANWVNTQK